MKLTLSAIVLVTLVGASACRRDAPAPTKSAPADPPRKLTLIHSAAGKPVAGTDVEATAEGLPPHRKVDLVWGTVDGGWVIEDHFRFRGKRFTAATRTLSQAVVDADGRLSVRFKVPEDYGGVHEVMVSDHGVTLAQGGIEVSPTFQMSPSEGPVGTPIEIRVTGLGWRTLDSTWVVNWDNREVGWVSATDTRGTATARFRATGPVGDHPIKVYTGYMGQGYLNYEQAPNAYLPRPGFVFRVTSGTAVTASAHAEPYQRVPAQQQEAGKAAIAVSPAQGPILTRASVAASGLPAGVQLSLVWGTQAGSRVTEAGFSPKETDLARVKADANGQLNIPVIIPDDLGGRHTLSIRSGDKTLAETIFVVETSIVSISPTSGPAGTPVSIHLKGVGWTDFDNIYVATYDNAYMGYACGFNSQGDVVVNFTAAGSPGVHLIDFYPGIYQGPPEGQQLYRLPQLTYADDHPGNKIPALRFAFEVTRP
ncbi:MAG: hypothetical protein ND807_13660 [Vicinamibacterales bacterium]|nr:hypothetical protein [Vicinamibacterales bacterium]